MEHVTAEKKAEYVRQAVELHAQGLTWQEAADKLGEDVFNIYRWRKEGTKEGPARTTRPRYSRDEKIALVREYNNRGSMTSPEWHKQKGLTNNLALSWVKRFGSAPVEEAREIVHVSNGNTEALKQLRVENQRLRIIVSDLMLDKQALVEYSSRGGR